MRNFAIVLSIEIFLKLSLGYSKAYTVTSFDLQPLFKVYKFRYYDNSMLSIFVI